MADPIPVITDEAVERAAKYMLDGPGLAGITWQEHARRVLEAAFGRTGEERQEKHMTHLAKRLRDISRRDSLDADDVATLNEAIQLQAVHSQVVREYAAFRRTVGGE